MSGFAIVRHLHRATPMIGEQPFNHYTAFRLRPGDYARCIAHGFSLNADAVMLDFEDAGAAPVEAAGARCLSLAEFAVVSPQEIHLRDGMSFAEAERFDPGGLDRRADCG
jgi:hypothetical protein